MSALSSKRGLLNRQSVGRRIWTKSWKMAEQPPMISENHKTNSFETLIAEQQAVQQWTEWCAEIYKGEEEVDPDTPELIPLEKAQAQAPLTPTVRPEQLYPQSLLATAKKSRLVLECSLTNKSKRSRAERRESGWKNKKQQLPQQQSQNKLQQQQQLHQVLPCNCWEHRPHP